MIATDEIDITHELARRRPRAADYQAESKAYRALASGLATSTSPEVLQKLSEIALRLCSAHSAGVSVLEEEDGRMTFKWRGLVGRWAQYLNGGLPRHESPCGLVLDRNETMLVENPGRVFPPMAGAEPKLFEGLLAPFRILGQPVGTVWVLSHDAERKFDGEDARVLEGLADFAAAAFMLMESLSGAVNARDELARSHARLMQSNDRLWVRMNSTAKEPQR